MIRRMTYDNDDGEFDRTLEDAAETLGKATALVLDLETRLEGVRQVIQRWQAGVNVMRRSENKNDLLHANYLEARINEIQLALMTYREAPRGKP